MKLDATLMRDVEGPGTGDSKRSMRFSGREGGGELMPFSGRFSVFFG